MLDGQTETLSIEHADHWALSSRRCCGHPQVVRLEGQVCRYKSALENSERMEDELKVEKRKLQREVNIVHVIESIRT